NLINENDSPCIDLGSVEKIDASILQLLVSAEQTAKKDFKTLIGSLYLITALSPHKRQGYLRESGDNMNIGDEFAQAYLDEAKEMLEELEAAALELEGNKNDTELVNRVFRAMHTIKGSGAMFGFNEISDFAHHMETCLDKVRSGVIPVSRDIIDLILLSRDEIARMLNVVKGISGNEPDRRNHIVDMIDQLVSGKKPLNEADVKQPSAAQIQPATPQTEQQKPESQAKSTEEPGNGQKIYRIRLRPSASFFSRDVDLTLLISELFQMGKLDIHFLPEHVPVLSEIDPEKCYLAWDILLTTDATPEQIQDVFMFVQDEVSLEVKEIGGQYMEDGDEPARLGEILVARGDITSEQLDDVLQKQQLGNLLSTAGIISREKVESALAEQNVKRSLAQPTQKAQDNSDTASVRVAAEKLDELVDIAGELVITQAHLRQAATTITNSAFLRAVEDGKRLSDRLRRCVLGIRMLPINTLFGRFKRLVRDLTGRLGKEVEFAIEGGETELDKTIIERLSDPLIHLLRNSADHGIELPDARKLLGKNPKGLIKLTAAHIEGQVVIRIHDDGQGLDPDKIIKKAIQKGLITSGESLSNTAIFNLIFEPGFSTAEQVTDVSGRGVGMDVVKREIDSLRGTVDIDSEKGKWTDIVLRLPLTLAIIDGLTVAVQKNTYVIPLHYVHECVALTQTDIEKMHGQNILLLRNEIIPYIRLRKMFGVDSDLNQTERIAVVNVGGIKCGLVIDKIIGRTQAVIKSLDKVFPGGDPVSGATIMGDGTVALILDVPRLVRSTSEITRRSRQ
ncbi:MAG: chemotaxis protein CheA, partial [Pseudomonadota bacterium]